MIAASVGVLLTAVLESSAVPAEPMVRWEAPPECGSARELQDRIGQQHGALESGIEIIGQVRRVDGLYALELELVVGDEHQRRSFSAVDCRTLLEAAALVGSAALSPDTETLLEPEPDAVSQLGSEPVPEPEPAPEALLVPAPPVPRQSSDRPAPVPVPASTEGPESAPVAASSSSRPRRGHWLVSARTGVSDDGTLTTPRGSLGVGHAWQRWRVQTGIEVLGNRARSPLGAVDLLVVAVDPRACAVVRPRVNLELLPCAGMAVGAAVGRGRDVPNARAAVVPWTAAHVDFELLVIPVRWLAVGVELSNYAMLGRPRFALSTGQTVYRAGTAGTRASIVVELRFSATDRAVSGH
ncbi:hypothetical protein [Paraliomyxa miuraensis]|uniref:hypothetical protein n=1 Tax=Paraliomyxa miuraensis TaxID=376150 RepID=UPI002255047C|nr:hypothetical protein [Paraliomyxa miuraensis]MCX4246349.1 hypothetical protein [Paraliomyxa miuraensis]